MMSDTVCPMCRNGVLARGEGRLDQSGDTFLPTVTWTCACCEYRVFEPARTAGWRPAFGQDAPPAPSEGGEETPAVLPRLAA